MKVRKNILCKCKIVVPDYVCTERTVSLSKNLAEYLHLKTILFRSLK